VGGNGPRVIDRVLAYGDEWMPNRIAGDDAFIARLNELAARAAEAGRGRIPVTLAGVMRDPARLERFERAGVHRGLFWLPAAERGEVEARLDEITAGVQEYASAGG
jgi:hypothetical protein